MLLRVPCVGPHIYIECPAELDHPIVPPPLLLDAPPRPRCYAPMRDGLLPHVQKPMRYLGDELHSVHKDWAATTLHVGLAFPDVYEIGMSHIGLRILYHMINARPTWMAERVFAPWHDMAARMRERGMPLCSQESCLPVRAFDVLGFSLQYELCYATMVWMLDLAGIPRRAADRTPEDPVVIGGGPTTVNPEPVAPFMDAVLIGDAEDVLADLLEAIEQGRAEGLDREQLWRRLARIPGVYVPGLYQAVTDTAGRLLGTLARTPDVPAVVERQWVRDLDTAPYPTAPVVPNMQIVHDRIVVEIMRGCTRGCRFCQAGMTYRPTRERSAATVQRIAEATYANTGWDTISLASLSSADHFEIEQMISGLVDRFKEERVGLSLPSLRLDAFTETMAAKIKEAQKGGFTFAPEAGSDRLRWVINKDITDEMLLETAELVFRLGWTHVKLYFMVGLPTETDADVENMAALINRVAAIGRAHRGRRAKVRVTISAFVPKAHTPFQWCAQLPVEELSRRVQLVLDRCRDRAIALSWREPVQYRVEGLLSRGGRDCARLIEAAVDGGATLDSWTSELDHALWDRILAEHGRDPIGEDWPSRVDAPLPWDHINAGVGKPFLQREWAQSLAGRFTEDCKTDICTACGVPCATEIGDDFHV